MNGIHGPLTALSAALMSSIVASHAAAQAQEPRVEAYVDPPEVAVGEKFRLVVEVRGAKEVESVLIPELFDFARCINPYDPAVEVGVGDEKEGPAANSVTLSYVFVSDRRGFFEMKPFRITADGREMETEAVAVLVGRSGVWVEARVEPSRVRVGDRFTLVAEVMGLESGSVEFIGPDVFDVADRAGSCGRGREFRCRLRARAPGEFVIAPVRVVDRDSTYESNPVTLVVTDEPPRLEVGATVESGSIWVGGEFVVSVEVTGTHELDEEPTAPETEDFAEFLGSEEPRLDGGSGGKGMTHRYRFRAFRAGRFEIGPVRIVAGGRTVETSPVAVTVDEVPAGGADPPGHLFLTTVAAKSRAYVGEPVIVTYLLAHGGHDLSPRIGTKSRPSLDAFDVLERPGYAREELDERHPGDEWIRADRFALLPRRSGQLEVGAVTLEVRVDNPRDLWARTSPDDFGRESTSSYVFTSNPLTLEVLPLPDEGRPASFRGHVGTLEVASRLNGTRVGVGVTVTMEVKVEVEGFVEGLPDPEIDFPSGFAVSEPEIRTDLAHYGSHKLRGTRTYTYQLTAVTPGRYEIPAVEMSFFDPATESYGTTRTHPFTVTVVPAGPEAR